MTERLDPPAETVLPDPEPVVPLDRLPSHPLRAQDVQALVRRHIG